MVTAVVVPLVWSCKAPDVSPAIARAVPAEVPALIVLAMFYPLLCSQTSVGGVAQTISPAGGYTALYLIIML
jgi:hypothetical protein